MDNNKRGSWASNFGFIMSAVGSAVGLGNIWAFPYRMGKSGGFSFLLIYILISATVGFTMLMSELAMGRKTGKGAIGAYADLSKKFKFLGWVAVIVPFLILSFYTVLGGYCLEYMCLNLSNICFASGSAFAGGAELFSNMLTNPLGALVFTLITVLICYLVNRNGVSGGIERFNKVGMPTLFFMLIVIIIRSLTLPNAIEGLKFMFVPGHAVSAGYIEKAPNLISVVAAAGSQVFFSLSLAMGIMITYGSYLSKKESLVKNSVIIAVFDTIVALFAGLAVLPAAVATGISQGIPLNELELGGPKLLYVTLQDVFNSMGAIGPIFGAIFYLLVFIAAITSIISLLEVVTTYFVDRDISRGIEPRRKKIILWVCIAVALESALVAYDSLGASNIWVPFRKTFGVIGAFNDCWLDFIDTIAEGILMPLGALLMSFMVAWEIKPKTLLEEINDGKKSWLNYFYTFCIRVIVPLVMILVFLGQMDSFFALGLFA